MPSVDGDSNVESYMSLAAVNVNTDLGSRVRSIIPANITVGSDFGLLTTTVSPVPLRIPAGSFFRVALPISWALANKLTCSASTLSASASRAEIAVKVVQSPYGDIA